MDSSQWKAPISASEHHVVAQGILRRGEAFLRSLFDDVPHQEPLERLHDLEHYLKSLPRQGSYFAEAARRLVAAPHRTATVTATIIGGGIDVAEQRRAHEASRVKADQEWREEWRGKVAASVPKYWELIEEAMSLNQE